VGADLGAAGISALLAGVVPDAVWWPQAALLAALPGYRARHDLTPAITIETSTW
jgi:hypothetical protein